MRAALCQRVVEAGTAHSVAAEDFLMTSLAKAGLSDVTHRPRDESGCPQTSDL